MTDIPLSANVECIDGLCGESTAIVVNPINREVTHFVVRDTTSSPPVERLVPVGQIEHTSQTLIRLRCTTQELANMQPFVETHYVPSDEPDYSHWTGGEAWQEPYAQPEGAAYTAVEEERVPPGELAFHRGTQVEASDGHIGEVGEFLIDPHSGHVTHIVLEEGHFWGTSAITLPLSAIDHVAEDTVYLKLTKEAVESLPSIPVKRRRGKKEVEGKNVELLARVFDDPGQAEETLEFVKDLKKRKVLKLLHTALLVKDEDGTTSLKESGDLDARGGRIFGAITGGLIGLIGGPVGVVVGALAGAGVGGMAAKRIDLGFSDEFLKSFQEQLEPGKAALLIIVEDRWVQKASEALADDPNLIMQQTLTDEAVQRLLEADKGETAAGGQSQ